jgi:GWxTD domain-containing protein
MFHYKHDFDPALSPMATSQRQPSKNLYVDTVFNISTNTPIYLKNEGLYYFSRDTSEAYGIGLIGVDGRFPKMTRPEKLARPLIYMSTSQEMTELLTSKDAKKSLDSYWLNLAQGNQNTAKRTIKSFYKRVDKANQLFTTYKDGWKTDKGMVWIIMGNPQRVVRTREKEIWTYSRTGQFSEINFTFVKRPNQFVEDHYELQRYAEFQSIWYPTVEQWRNGDIRAMGN